MPEAGRTHHVTLRDSSGTNKTGLRLLRDPNGKLLYGWRLAPALAPDVPPEDVQYGQFNPDQELTWAQNDWQKGGLKFYYNPRESAMYGIADKVWPATANELALGPPPLPLCFGIGNGSFELNATTGFTVSGVTLTVITTAPFTGIYHAQGASYATNDYIAAVLANLTRWQSGVITVSAWVRNASGTGGQIRMQIVESGGASTPTTSGTAVGLTATYQNITASVTLQPDTTGVSVRVQMSDDEGTVRTVYIDQVECFGGGVTTPEVQATKIPLRILRMGTKLYCCTESAVWEYDTTNHKWELDKYFAAAITGFEVWDDRLYVALGASTAYQYSDPTDATIWTSASGSGNKANHFMKALNANGNWALAKTLLADEVYLTTDPTGTPVWGSAIGVGKDDHAIVRLYNVNGNLMVAKTDGLYIHRDLEGNRFINVYGAAEQFISTDNFRWGILHDGLFYTSLYDFGFAVWDGVTWENLSLLLSTPGFTEFGNKVRGLGSDGRRLYILVQDRSDAGSGTTCFLLTLERVGQQVHVHVLASLRLSQAQDMAIFNNSDANDPFNRSFLFINGYMGNTSISYQIPLPIGTTVPRLGSTESKSAFIALSGTFVTSYWDGNRPDVLKVAHSLALTTENLNANRTITVAYQIDDESSWTNINSSDSIYETSPYQTINFNANLSFRRIRLRFTFDSNVTSSSPVLKSFVLRMHWRPARKKVWDFTGLIEDQATGLQGVSTLSAKKMLSQLDTLRNATNDVTLEDIDGTETTGHIIDAGEEQVQDRPDTGGSLHYSRGVRVVFMEG